MRIFLIDEHPLFREGLRHLLQPLTAAPDLLELALFDTGSQALALPDDTPPPNLILTDWLRGSSTLAGLKTLQQRYWPCPVVVVCADDSPELARKLMAHGVARVVPKHSTPGQLMTELRQVLNGDIAAVPGLPPGRTLRTGSAQNSSPTRDIARMWPDMTERQIDVFRAALRGLANKEIARELAISDGTVKQHLSAIYQLLGVSGKTGAVSVAAQRGLRME